MTLEGGGGTGAEAVAQLEDPRRNEDGQVQNNPRGLVGIALTNSGSGYTQAPTVIISGGGGRSTEVERMLWKGKLKPRQRS